MKRVILPILILFCLQSLLFANSPTIFTIIVDNYECKEGLQTDWGFSCLIEGTEKTILFDTGRKEEIFLNNSKALNINFKDVDIVVISHNHGDHTGGLKVFLQKNPNIELYLPASTPNPIVAEIKNGGTTVKLKKDPVEICKDVYLTGEMGDQIKEHGLIIKGQKESILITGCAHPYVIDMTKQAKAVLKEPIDIVLGGFHLLQKSESEVNGTINEFRELGVKKVGATHCTGEKAIAQIRKAFHQDFIEMGVGRKIMIQ